MATKFYVCAHCGNVIEKVYDKGVPVVCCGEKMGELVANTTDAAQEKHVPVVAVDNGSVQVSVGSVPHPMTAEHQINWIWLETTNGGQRKVLEPDAWPEAAFQLTEGEIPLAAYAFCNLHGLWKSEIK